jgi:Mrp family chromosome partitioning ATPase
VSAATDVVPQGESDVLDVMARAASPTEAAELANGFARAALDARRDLLAPLVRSLITRAEADLRAEQRVRGAAPEALNERLSRLRVLADGTDPNLSLAQLAQPPATPSGTPLIALLILATVVGGGLAVAAAIATDLVRPPRITAEQQLEGITGLPVLARVPRLRQSARHEGPAPPAVPASAAVAFRSLGSRFERGGGLPRSIMVTSPSRGDGKTTSALQLGLTLCATGHDVLLIDLDPRGPQLTRSLGVEVGRDLRHARWDEGWRDAVIDVAGAPGLHLLIGDATPNGGAGSDLVGALARVLRAMAAEFDCIVIDAPALGDTDAAEQLLRAVDVVLIVTRLDGTTAKDLETAAQTLERGGRKATGLVVVGSSDRQEHSEPGTHRPVAAR